MQFMCFIQVESIRNRHTQKTIKAINYGNKACIQHDTAPLNYFVTDITSKCFNVYVKAGLRYSQKFVSKHQFKAKASGLFGVYLQ